MVSAEGFAAKEETVHPLIGQVFEGRYRIIEMIGEGASGWVFKAEHVTMGQGVALKVLREEAKQNMQMVKRFISEARTSSQLRDPHTVRVFDFGAADDGELFIAMEWLVGKPLSDALEEVGHLPPARVAHITRQICYGLREAHNLGLVHRDLKPENVFLVESGGDPDFAKILDFGIAKAVEGQALSERRTKLTEMGATLGTPWYMSPEQACALDLDRRSDLYSLGVMMYEMLSGELPFDGDVGMKVLMQHVNDLPPPLPESVGGVGIPEDLRDLTMQLLEKKPSLRPADAEEVANRLKRSAARWTSPHLAAQTPAYRSTAEAATQTSPAVEQAKVAPAPVAPAIASPAPRGRGGLIAFLVIALLAAGGAAAYFALSDRGSNSPNGKDGSKTGTAGAVDSGAVNGNAAGGGEDLGSATSKGQSDTGASTVAEADAVSSVDAGGGAGTGPSSVDGGPEDGGVKANSNVVSRPKPDAPKVDLTTPRIEEILGRNVGGLRKCITSHVSAGVVHKLKVSFTIQQSGVVKGARVTPVSGALGRCIVKVIARIKFPAHERGSIKFSFPITAENKG